MNDIEVFVFKRNGKSQGTSRELVVHHAGTRDSASLVFTLQPRYKPEAAGGTFFESDDENDDGVDVAPDEGKTSGAKALLTQWREERDGTKLHLPRAYLSGVPQFVLGEKDAPVDWRVVSIEPKDASTYNVLYAAMVSGREISVRVRDTPEKVQRYIGVVRSVSDAVILETGGTAISFPLSHVVYASVGDPDILGKEGLLWNPSNKVKTLVVPSYVPERPLKASFASPVGIYFRASLLTAALVWVGPRARAELSHSFTITNDNQFDVPCESLALDFQPVIMPKVPRHRVRRHYERSLMTARSVAESRSEVEGEGEDEAPTAHAERFRQHYPLDLISTANSKQMYVAKTSPVEIGCALLLFNEDNLRPFVILKNADRAVAVPSGYVFFGTPSVARAKFDTSVRPGQAQRVEELEGISELPLRIRSTASKTLKKTAGERISNNSQRFTEQRTLKTELEVVEPCCVTISPEALWRIEHFGEEVAGVASVQIKFFDSNKKPVREMQWQSRSGTGALAGPKANAVPEPSAWRVPPMEKLVRKHTSAATEASAFDPLVISVQLQPGEMRVKIVSEYRVTFIDSPENY